MVSPSQSIKEHSFIHRWNSGVEIVYNPFKNGIMPIDMRNKMFPKDAKYRAELAQSLGVSNPEKLSSVVGTQELKAILKNSKQTNFVPKLGEDNKPTNPDFCINLHIHSKYSDGCLEVQDILDQAQQYAEETSKPFLFSISDHDSLEGTKEALELISKDSSFFTIQLVPIFFFTSDDI